MELKLEHVLLLLLFVFLFSRCNRLTEGVGVGGTCRTNKDCDGFFTRCNHPTFETCQELNCRGTCVTGF